MVNSGSATKTAQYQYEYRTIRPLARFLHEESNWHQFSDPVIDPVVKYEEEMNCEGRRGKRHLIRLGNFWNGFQHRDNTNVGKMKRSSLDDDLPGCGLHLNFPTLRFLFLDLRAQEISSVYSDKN